MLLTNRTLLFQMFSARNLISNFVITASCEVEMCAQCVMYLQMLKKHVYTEYQLTRAYSPQDVSSSKGSINIISIHAPQGPLQHESISEIEFLSCNKIIFT